MGIYQQAIFYHWETIVVTIGMGLIYALKPCRLWDEALPGASIGPLPVRRAPTAAMVMDNGN